MYLAPDMEIVPYAPEIMDVITTSPTPAGPEAKEANEFIEEKEESLPVDKSIWEDEEE